MPDALLKPPNTIVAGDSYLFKHGFDARLSAGYTIWYRIRGLTEFDKSTTTAEIAISAAESASFKSGVAGFVITAEKVGERITLSSGRLDILPDPTATGNLNDHRSFLQRALDAVEAYMLGRADNGQIDHIKAVLRNNDNEQSLERMSYSDLFKLRNELKARLNLESGKFPKRILYTFV